MLLFHSLRDGQVRKDMPERSISEVRQLCFQIFYSCSQKCIFCSESRNNERFNQFPIQDKEVARVLLTQRRRGVDSVMFTGGGEPTQHPQFPGVLRMAKALGLRTSVTTNGCRLSDGGFARKVLPLLDEICLSIHGDCPSLHDGITRTPGSFARLMSAYRNVRDFSKTPLTTFTTVTRQNLRRMSALTRFVLWLD
mgnify:FL=1